MRFQDKVTTPDVIEVGLSARSAAPKSPCPKCGKESKDHDVFRKGRPEPIKARICSNRACRLVFGTETVN